MNKENNDTEKNDDAPSVSSFRRALPQILATSAKNLILLDLGMTLAFPTLVIPALLNSNQKLNFNTSQASWFGSIAFICQPIGSIISGTVLEPLGRKKSMLLVNIPHLLGWLLYYYAVSVPILFVASIMMGLGVGFMEAPVITYVGEISEPSLRGILTSYSGIFVTVGLIAEFLLGTLFDWNTAALISAFVPIFTMIAIYQVPETPMWLLSKGRLEEAEKSLCWLRGWVEPAYVAKELNELIRYSNSSKLVLKEKPPKSKEKLEIDDKKTEDVAAMKEIYCNPVNISDELPNYEEASKKQTVHESNDACKYGDLKHANDDKTKTNDPKMESKDDFETISLSDNNLAAAQKITERKPTVKEVIADMIRPQMLRPLMLVIAFFVFHNGSGFPAIRPYMVTIFEELRFPVDSHWATVVISIVGFVGVIICTICVPYVGKRILTLVSLGGCSCSILSLAFWTYTNEQSVDKSPCWTPFIQFILFSFSFSIGIAPIPWMILSEIFPYRGRGFASGVAAAISYIMGFFTSKTFLDLKRIFGLAGVFSMYGMVTLIGIAYVYFKLPETEGRSLEDIENLYKNKKNKK